MRSSRKDELCLFDFTQSDQVDNWTESSDTKKSNGTSKAVFVIQKTKLKRRAILFTLLNPKSDKQPGLSFASVICEINVNLSNHDCIAMKCRGQGTNFGYKMILKHDGVGKNALVYGQTFMVSDKNYTIIKIPLINFKPYYGGHQLPANSYNLDVFKITHIGIKIDNGLFLPNNQLGVSVLEIDWIKAIK